jgi:hypothetical protein
MQPSELAAPDASERRIAAKAAGEHQTWDASVLPVLADAIIARTVRRHRPQSAPAPQACATSFVVDAPAATASLTI